MLLLVVVLFLVTEFPQGVTNLLNGNCATVQPAYVPPRQLAALHPVTNLLNGILTGFVDEIYASLGDLLDILALINNGINFLLYCTMSKQFRDTFIQLFVAGRCCCRSSTTSSMTSNIDNTAAAVIRGDITIPLNAIDTAITLTGGTSSRRLQPGEITSGVVCTVKPRPATVMH